MTSPTSNKTSSRAWAFTLIEVLLALVIMVMLVSVAAIGVGGGVNHEYLDEGASRIETALRLARAEAATRGRRLMLSFDEQGRIAMLWEPQPLAEPGEFVPFVAAGWARDMPNELVAVDSCVLTDADVYRPPSSADVMTNEDSSDEPITQPITFRPDGTCDSAQLTLRSTDPHDQRRAIVDVDGLNAVFTTRLLTPSEIEEQRP